MVNCSRLLVRRVKNAVKNVECCSHPVDGILLVYPVLLRADCIKNVRKLEYGAVTLKSELSSCLSHAK